MWVTAAVGMACGGNGNRRDEVTVDLEGRGRGSLPELAADLGEMHGIVNVSVGEYERVMR